MRLFSSSVGSMCLSIIPLLPSCLSLPSLLLYRLSLTVNAQRPTLNEQGHSILQCALLLSCLSLAVARSSVRPSLSYSTG